MLKFADRFLELDETNISNKNAQTGITKYVINKKYLLL